MSFESWYFYNTYLTVIKLLRVNNTMGGFRLLGPNYTIQNLHGEIMCKCPGYKGEISEELETHLVNDVGKPLDKALIKGKGGAHFGENLYYKVISKSEDEDFDGERERFKARKAEKKQKRLEKQAEIDWTPWDGKSLESVATRELDAVDNSIFQWDKKFPLPKHILLKLTDNNTSNL